MEGLDTYKKGGTYIKIEDIYRERMVFYIGGGIFLVIAFILAFFHIGLTIVSVGIFLMCSTKMRYYDTKRNILLSKTKE